MRRSCATLLAIVAMSAIGACSSSGTSATTETTLPAGTTTQPRGHGVFADVPSLSKWLATKGVICPARPDGASCDLKSIEGSKVTAEVVEAAVAPDADTLDQWFATQKGGYVMTLENADGAWGLHFDGQTNADALLKAIPDASSFAAID
jgi:hypothetical protein